MCPGGHPSILAIPCPLFVTRQQKKHDPARSPALHSWAGLDFSLDFSQVFRQALGAREDLARHGRGSALSAFVPKTQTISGLQLIDLATRLVGH